MPEEQQTYHAPNEQDTQSAGTQIKEDMANKPAQTPEMYTQPKEIEKNKSKCAIGIIAAALAGAILAAAVAVPVTYNIVRDNLPVKDESDFSIDYEIVTPEIPEDSTQEDEQKSEVSQQTTEAVKITQISNDVCRFSLDDDLSLNLTKLAMEASGPQNDKYDTSFSAVQCFRNPKAIEIQVNPDFYESYGIEFSSGKLDQTFEFSVAPQMIAAGAFGQGDVSNNYLFIVLQNGTIFYLNPYQALKDGKFQFKKIDGINDATFVAQATYLDGAGVIAGKSSGGHYDLANYIGD